jgi:hypothetical protein
VASPLQQAGQQTGGCGFPTDEFGAGVFADHEGAAAGQVEVVDVEGEDFAGAGGAVIEQPPQCFVPQRMLGGQEGPHTIGASARVAGQRHSATKRQ